MHLVEVLEGGGHLQHSFGLGRVIVCCIDRLNPPP